MFSFFKRRKKVSPLSGVYAGIGKVAGTAHRRTAEFLNRKTSGLSGRTQMIGLVVFSLLFASGSVFVLWQAFQPDRHAPFLHPGQHSQPFLPDAGVARQGVVLSPEEVAQIKNLRRQLDSLQASRSGKSIYDSLLMHRKGLLDSLSFIENIYHQQFKQNEDE